MQYLSSLRARIRKAHPNLLLFAGGMALLGIAGSMFETTFNNFLSDRFHLAADARGFLEFPRELPGFLTALFAGLLFFVAETHIAAAAALCVGIGMIGIAVWGGSWWFMIALMTLWSTGAHVIMPVRSSISMDLAHEGGKGRRLGQIQGLTIAADAPLTLRYLLHAHRGAYDHAKAQSVHESFAARPGFQITKGTRPHCQYDVARKPAGP